MANPGAFGNEGMNGMDGSSVDRMLRSVEWRSSEIALHRAVRSAGAVIGAHVPERTTSFSASRQPYAPTATLGAVLESRHSCRDFSGEPVLLDELFDVLASALRTSGGRPASAVPGGVPAVSTKLIVNRVLLPGGDALRQGIYELELDCPSITCVSEVSFAKLGAVIDMTDIVDPPVAVLFCLHIDTRRRYDNAYELGLLEIGQLIQNIALVATAKGWGSCALGSVFDEPFWTAVSPGGVTRETVLAHGAPIVSVAIGKPSEFAGGS